jgi:hypothetical protein
MTKRYSARRTVHYTASVSYHGLLEQATIVNLSAPGCRLETSLPLRAGEYVQLRITHAPGQPPLVVELAAIRWVDGWKAGLEFIRCPGKTKHGYAAMSAFTQRRRAGSQRGVRP